MRMMNAAKDDCSLGGSSQRFSGLSVHVCFCLMLLLLLLHVSTRRTAMENSYRAVPGLAAG